MVDALTAAILGALQDAPEGMSLPRLGKRLGFGASVLLRRLHLLSEAQIGGQDGPGLVHVASLDGRWMVSITEAGIAALRESPVPPGDTADGHPGV